MTVQVDYARITAIVHKMADWLEDLGFSNPRQDIDSPGLLNRAVNNPRTEADLRVIKEFFRSLREDIEGDRQVHPSDKDIADAEAIVAKAYKALSGCFSDYAED